MKTRSLSCIWQSMRSKRPLRRVQRVRAVKGMRTIGWILGVFSVVWTARADMRSYVWTYEYLTMGAGGREVEYYLTLRVPDTGVRSVHEWNHQLELEYGLTPRWDVALYQVWAQRSDESSTDFDYQGFKLRTRYRFAEEGQWPLDVLLYGEYKRKADLGEPEIGEFKVILARRWGRFDIAWNQIVERPLESESGTEHKFAAGTGVFLTDHLHAGIETVGNFRDDHAAIGPTLALHGERIYFAAGFIAGLNDRAPDLMARTIIGIVF